ncbi:hypothetical protein DSL72_006899 [Monilinia vaccinii-corymbosi]|uniref:Uncharacterized protein n=1 Tax=Monilinia vaccinii-corymbosi TaxID=61207 RepID=A0A8A3PK49_9HELO|nr:hypothetical protein DSL72_006899 [Monilinia vaccinii-corymbosi]
MSSPSEFGPGNAGNKMVSSSSARNTAPSEQQSGTTIPSPQQLPVLAPAASIAKVTCEEVEELRDRLFKLTSDYQRLYGVFMTHGDASPNALTWNLADIDLAFLFKVRQQVVNLHAATKRIESEEEMENHQAFIASQRKFYSSLVGVVTSAIGRLARLRRDLEGPGGFAYQYPNWYYQIIGNNPRSTNNSSLRMEGEKKGEDGNSYEGPGQIMDDEERRPEKRRKM